MTGERDIIWIGQIRMDCGHSRTLECERREGHPTLGESLFCQRCEKPSRLKAVLVGRDV